MIVSRDIGQKFTVSANVGYRKNFDLKDADSTFTGVAVARSFGPYDRGMTEFTSEKGPDGRRNDVRIGWVRVLFPKKSSRYETSFFTSVGKSVGRTPDGRSHTMVLVGLNFTRKPN